MNANIIQNNNITKYIWYKLCHLHEIFFHI